MKNYKEIITDWLAQREYSPKTIESYLLRVRLLDEFFADDSLEDITEAQIREYFDYMINRRKYAARTVHQAHNAFKRVFNEVYGRDYDFSDIDLPSRKVETPETLTPKEILDLMGSAPKRIYKLIFATMYSAGLTLGEVRQLKISDINFRHRKIFVQQDLGHKSREAILSEYLAKELKEFIADEQPEKWVFEGKFKGKQISESAIHKNFQKALRRSSIEKQLTPQHLKYSYVVHMRQDGIPLIDILDYLGMSTSVYSRTFRFYSVIRGSDKRIDFSPLDRIFSVEEIPFDARTIERMLFDLEDDDERKYLLEALECLRAGIYRAAVIFSWNAAMQNIYNRCLQHSQHNLNQAIRRHYPDAPEIKKVDDFSYIRDSTVLQACRDLRIFDKNQKNILVEKLNLRNKCGHPGKYKPKPLVVAGFLEDLVSIVFT
jgi:site-specific recombinase XerD